LFYFGETNTKQMDLNKLIREKGLRFDYVASQLFPKNKHPYNALNRVITQGRELTASQVLTLSGLLGMSADDILKRLTA